MIRLLRGRKQRLIAGAIAILLIAAGATMVFTQSRNDVHYVNVGGNANPCQCSKRLDR